MDLANDLGLIISYLMRQLSFLWLRKIFNCHLAEVLECGVQREGVTDMARDDHREPSKHGHRACAQGIGDVDISHHLIAI